MDGGHAYPTSTYSPIRYYTLQIRPQCVKCNRFNGGAPKEFEEYLTRELGTEKVNWLKSLVMLNQLPETLKTIMKRLVKY